MVRVLTKMVKKAKKIAKLKKSVLKNEKKQNKKSILKNEKKQNKVKKNGFIKRSFTFLKEIKSELKKVVWPTKKGLINGTLTVFIMVIIVASIVVVADFIFRHLLKLILGIV